MITIGIIGCGYWGPNIARNFNSIEGASVKYCCDLDDERLRHMKSLYPEIATTKDYMELINDEMLDAVAIITPVSTHYKFAREALDRGKHVLVEKPITNNSEHAQELIRLAISNKKILMVDHTFEYTAAVNKVKEIIKSGEMGRIFTIDMIRVNLGLFQKDINVIWDLAPHDISILNYVLGRIPESVRAFGEDFIQKGIEDDARIIIKYPDNITANLHVSWLDPCKIRKATIVGSKKMLVYDDIEQHNKIKMFDKGVELKTNSLPKDGYYDTWEEFRLTYRRGEEKFVKIEYKEPLKEMAEHFIDCIISGKRPRSDGFSGLNVVKAIEAAQESLKKEGKEILVK